MAECWDRLPRKVVVSLYFSGEIQNPPECMPLSLALGDTATSLPMGIGISDFQRPLPSLTILGFREIRFLMFQLACYLPQCLFSLFSKLSVRIFKSLSCTLLAIGLYWSISMVQLQWKLFYIYDMPIQASTFPSKKYLAAFERTQALISVPDSWIVLFYTVSSYSEILCLA